MKWLVVHPELPLIFKCIQASNVTIVLVRTDDDQISSRDFRVTLQIEPIVIFYLSIIFYTQYVASMNILKYLPMYLISSGRLV
jgi:hypothetical protein